MNVESILASKGREVSTIRPGASVAEALHRMRAERVGALVVSEDGATVAGIVSDRGIMWALDERGVDVLGESVGSIMTREVITCARDDRIGALMAIMTDRRVRHLPVVEDGRLCGIVSIGDVVKHRMSELEFERDQLDHYVHGA